jgi:hypothetical protein
MARPWAWVAASNSPPVEARLGVDGARLRIDGDTLHAAKIDDDAGLANCCAGDAVAAAIDRQRQPFAAGKVDREHDVVGIVAASDQRRAPVDHAVVDLAGVVISRIARMHQRALEAGQLETNGLGHRHGSYSVGLFFSVDTSGEIIEIR